MTDLDRLDALPVGAYVATALAAAKIPCDSGEDVDRFLSELAKLGYEVAAVGAEAWYEGYRQAVSDIRHHRDARTDRAALLHKDGAT